MGLALLNADVFGWGYPPLPCRASPPQGGRLDGGGRFRNIRQRLCRDVEPIERSERRRSSISPLEGEMSGRTEGGDRTLPTSQQTIEGARP
jgi:hypothetical protein